MNLHFPITKTTEKRPQWNTINIHAIISLKKLNLDIQLLKNSTTRLLMANSRVQQESKMQQQHYGVNTRPVMTIVQFRYRLQSQVNIATLHT